MRRIVLVASTALLFLGAAAADDKLAKPGEIAPPELGTTLAPLPPGPGKALAQKDCLRCHSSDILRQQRLTEKQWTAVVDKMIRWGAEVPEPQKAALIAYLVRRFGPDNDRFVPVVTRPASKR